MLEQSGAQLGAGRPAGAAAMYWCWLAGLLAALPVLFTERPPMVDLPQHAAQIAMLTSLLQGDWAYRELFEIQWFIPYLSAYAPIFVLSKLMSIVLATKLVVALSLAALPISVGYLLREYEGDPFYAWLLLPVSYGCAFIWGFLNFLVAAPLGMALLILASRYARARTLRRALGLLVMVHLLFFAHVLCVFFFGALAALIVVLRSDSVLSAAKGLLPMLLLAPVGLSWGLPSMQTAQANWPVIWELGWERFYALPVWATGAPDTLGFTLVFIMLLLLPALAGSRPSRSVERYIPLVLCSLIYFLAPNLLAGTYFTYHRFAMFLVPLYLLIWDVAPEAGPRSAKLARVAIAAMGICWVGMMSVKFSGYDRESRDFPPIVEAMRPQSRVLSAVFEKYSHFSMVPVYLHYPVWAQAEKGGLVDFNFASFQGLPVHYLKLPPVNNRFVWLPETIDWETHEVGRYDYIVARIDPAAADGPFSLEDCRISLIKHSGAWWLYGIHPDAVQAPGCPGRKTS